MADKLRFAQARSFGVIMVLASLLALVLYNTIAEGASWDTREQDVRLMMTLLSILLGIDVLVGKHREILSLIGNVLVSYAERDSSRTPDYRKREGDPRETTNHETSTDTEPEPDRPAEPEK